jgi:DNA-directed RNA polymerase subunit beta
MKNAKPTFDLIDAKTGDVVHEGGKKLSPRQAKKLAEGGLTHLAVVEEDLYGQYIAQDLVNLKTGEIFAEAGDEIDEKLLTKLKDAGFDELPILDIDHVNCRAPTSATRSPSTRTSPVRTRCSTSTA